jgi:hypothetical protein
MFENKPDGVEYRLHGHYIATKTRFSEIVGGSSYWQNIVELRLFSHTRRSDVLRKDLTSHGNDSKPFKRKTEQISARIRLIDARQIENI